MKKTIALVISVLLVFNIAASATDTMDMLADTAAYVIDTVNNPQIGVVGGEWAIIGLARSEFSVPDGYFNVYYDNILRYVKEKQGRLHSVKYTEYSRVVMALTAIGHNPCDVDGYDLTLPLGDFEKTIQQGINGSIFALIALDCGDYSMPVNKDADIQATREMYINDILERQLPDGGFTLSGDNADPDITGMALQALSKYLSNERVETAVDKAVACMSNLVGQVTNIEGYAQIIVALGELGIDINDSRFIKDGKNLAELLGEYYMPDGGFRYKDDGTGDNQMATEQGLYALASVKRSAEGQSSLYTMGRSVSAIPTTDTEYGLPNKEKDVIKKEITKQGRTFSDIQGHKNQQAIEALASREIINGKSETAFDPDATMTRAEFATIVVQALGLELSDKLSPFTDVLDGEWYHDYVTTANLYDIVKGTSDSEFSPNGTITKEQAAAMTARAATLCGMETTLGDTEIRDILSAFGDYKTVSDWALQPLAFCYKYEVLDSSELDITPGVSIKRCEIAEMLFRLLEEAELL